MHRSTNIYSAVIRQFMLAEFLSTIIANQLIFLSVAETATEEKECCISLVRFLMPKVYRH